MTAAIFVLGEALMDCLAQPNGQLLPLMGGSPFNMARAAALHGANVAYLNPLSTDLFGQGMAQRLTDDGVRLLGGHTSQPTSLAVVQLYNGQPSYSFYREGIADRAYSVDGIVDLLRQQKRPGIFHTGSLVLIPPEHQKVLAILQAARSMGWTVSVDINLRPMVAPDLPAYVQALHDIMGLTDWLKASDEDLQTLGFTDVRMTESPHLVRKLRQIHTPSDPERQQATAPQILSRVALTFGGEGAYLDVAGQSHCLPAPHITLADTVGAGDTFWGNTLADWAIQPENAAERVAQTLAFSMKAAAINCTRQGCQPPTQAQVQAWPLA